MRLVHFTAISFYLSIKVGVQKNGQNIKKSSLSLATFHFTLCLMKFMKIPVQEGSSSPHPRQNPVSVSLQRTRSEGNVSLVWLHIKPQKVSLEESEQLKISCINCTVVSRMNKFGAVVGFLAVKSFHLNQSFALCPVVLKRATESYP